MTVVISPPYPLNQPGTVLRKGSVPDAVSGDYVLKGVMSALTFTFSFLQIPAFAVTIDWPRFADHMHDLGHQVCEPKTVKSMS
jgi:hypothetical protein